MHGVPRCEKLIGLLVDPQGRVLAGEMDFGRMVSSVAMIEYHRSVAPGQTASWSPRTEPSSGLTLWAAEDAERKSRQGRTGLGSWLRRTGSGASFPPRPRASGGRHRQLCRHVCPRHLDERLDNRPRAPAWPGQRDGSGVGVANLHVGHVGPRVVPGH